jgi:DNA repair exonuclease SbcCD nuclease subunit
MRFLHAADLHLGLRVTRFGAEVNGRLQEARLKALEHLIGQATARAVDFLLIAGDLFDDNHVDAATSRRTFELFESAGRPVYIIPGNHDPMTADSVFARPPWSLPSAGMVQLMRNPESIPLPGGTLLPCPLFAKNSFDDPTRWILPRESGDRGIRIGLAHGSLNERANLPPDDHLIDCHAADTKGLDYLALGHWHSPYRLADRAGVTRTVYPGVHEPMRFCENPLTLPSPPGEEGRVRGEFSIGWSAYSNTTRTDLFSDDGKGRALVVTIDSAGAAPVIEEIETGRLQWRDESYTLRDEEELSKLIDELGRRKDQEHQLLRLHLSGTLPARALLRLDELDGRLAGGQGGILSRYTWAELDTERLHAEPADLELQDRSGNGVVRAVYERLKTESQSSDANSQQRARQALLLLYRFTKEAKA